MPANKPPLNVPVESLRPFSSDWIAPGRDVVRQVLDACGLDRLGAKAFLGCSGKDVNKWTTGEATIAYSCWALLCVRAGLGAIWEEEPKSESLER